MHLLPQQVLMFKRQTAIVSLLIALKASSVYAFGRFPPAFVNQQLPQDAVVFPTIRTTRTATTATFAIDAMTACKDELISLVQSTPSGQATPRRLTRQILSCVRQLEGKCPTPQESVLDMIQGPWELLWTAQDPSTPESRQNWINPLENQAYSNNPEGRSNPFLPLPVQEALEKLGWVSSSSTSPSPQQNQLRSTQTINGELVRNIVAFNLASGNNSRRASVTLDIQARPDIFNKRRINVKFDRCRISIPSFRINVQFGLGLLGPEGWIQNVFVDEELRVSRGHKGSVFVLMRPRRAAV